MNVLVTAGPTREYIDPIRFITNASSGKQGLAIAEQAKRKGHNVILIMGPCSIAAPKEMPIVRVTTADEMLKSVLQYKDWMDVLVMNAAVGDWKVSRTSKQKIKKAKGILTLKLQENPDILAYMAKVKKQKKTERNPLLVGFCVETNDLLKNARQKLIEKNIDLIVANPAEAIGSNASESIILDKTGKVLELPLFTKKDLAKKIMAVIQGLRK